MKHFIQSIAIVKTTVNSDEIITLIKNNITAQGYENPDDNIIDNIADGILEDLLKYLHTKFTIQC